MATEIYSVVVNKDDTVSVVSRAVTETKQFYKLAPEPLDWKDPGRYAFGYRSRIEKANAHLTPRAALEAYMEKRQRDKQNALTVAGQATKQIASANELLMKCDHPVEVATA